MKLLLTITLFASLIFASNVKKVNMEGYKFFFGTNHDIPQKGIYPKINETLDFYIVKDGRKKISSFQSIGSIIDNKQEIAWNVFQKSSEINCSDISINKSSIKEIDLNLLRFILEAHTNEKDITIWVKVKDGRNSDMKNFKAFSLVQNKYLDNYPHSYNLCIKTYNYRKNKNIFDNANYLYEGILNKKKAQLLDIKKRNHIKYADMSDQGLILEIKEPLVKVQYSHYIRELSTYLPMQKWIRIDELTFKKHSK